MMGTSMSRMERESNSSKNSNSYKKIIRYDTKYVENCSERYTIHEPYEVFGQNYIKNYDLKNEFLKVNKNSAGFDRSFSNAKGLIRKDMDYIFQKTYRQPEKNGSVVKKTISRNYPLENLFFLNDLGTLDDVEELRNIIKSSIPKKTFSSIKAFKNEGVLTPSELVYFAIFSNDSISKVIMREFAQNITDNGLRDIFIQRKEILKKVTLKNSLETLDQYANGLIKKFQEDYSSELSNYGIHKNEIAKRLSSTKIILTDPMIYALESTAGKSRLGVFQKWDNKINVAITRDETMMNKVCNHEILHQLSGQTIIKKKGRRDDTAYTAYFMTRLGMTFNDSIDYSRLNTRSVLHWLNEAVTEDLSSELLKNNNPHVYAQERELFSLLQTSGKKEISKDTFRRAYFEDFNPNKRKHIPYWKEMWRLVQKSYDNTFLQRLDSHVNKHGVNSAIEIMKQDYKKI